MFTTWMRGHDLREFPLDVPLFPGIEDRAFWEKYLKKTQIRKAEKRLHCDWPLIRAGAYIAYARTGDRLAQEMPHFARRHQLIDLFLGELAENKGRFLEDICDGIFAVCEETYWGVSAHNVYTNQFAWIPNAEDPYIDLFAAETGELLAVICHIMGDKLDAYCPGIRGRLEYELQRRIITPYLTHSDYFWMGRVKSTAPVNNWNPWILSNILTVFLLMEPGKTRLHTGLKRMFGEIQRYYDTVPADGGCDEGPLYWTKAGGKLLSFCDQLYIASGGRIDLFEDEKLRRIGSYEAAAYIGGTYVVNFADGSARLTEISADYELYVFGLRTGQESLCRLAATLKRQRGDTAISRGISIKSTLFSLIYADAIDAREDMQPASSCVLPQLQMACLREGDWFYAAKGGHNAESHNHNDVGSCIVYHENSPVLVDAGSGVYTGDTFSEKRYSIWNMRSQWHNLPTVNGVEQQNGRQFAADSFLVHAQRTEISYAGAYPEEAGLQSAVRRIDMDETGVIIQDRWRFREETNRVQLHFLTALKPDTVSGGVVLGGKYLLKTDLPCTVEWKDFAGDPRFLTSWQTDGLTRLTLTLECGREAAVTTEIRSL